MTFDQYNFEPQVNKGLEELNFTEPTAIQEKSIPLILEGTDIIGSAETGSGKTGAFAIPIFSQLIKNPDETVLVLTPTRELAQQVADFMRLLAKFETSITVTTLVGGVDIRKQLKGLKRKPRIVVGTPGRVTDHLKRRSLDLTKTKYLVIDEGDRMLDMGFAPQLDAILNYVPKERQTCLYTATLPPKVKKLANKYLKEPRHIQVGKISKPVESIHQQVIEVDERMKGDLILDELNARTGSVIVFLKTKRRTNNLFNHLKDYAYPVTLIHGGRSQSQRNQALQSFRKGQCRILCATDVAARGLDIPEVEHVINFDLPVMKEDYLHRIGRTARNGAKGEAVSFVAPQERSEWRALVQEFKIAGAELSESKKKSKGKQKNTPNIMAKRSSGDRPKCRGAKENRGREKSVEELWAEDSRPERPRKKFGKKGSQKKRFNVRSRDDDSRADSSTKKRSTGKKKPFGAKKSSGGKKWKVSSGSGPDRKKSSGRGSARKSAGGSRSGGFGPKRPGSGPKKRSSGSRNRSSGGRSQGRRA